MSKWLEGQSSRILITVRRKVTTLPKVRQLREEKQEKINKYLCEIIRSEEDNPEKYILKRDDSDTLNAYKNNVRAVESCGMKINNYKQT